MGEGDEVIESREGDGLDGQDNAKPVCPRDRMREI